MAACGSLQHIFEKPLSENNSTLFDSISSWKQHNIQSTKKSSPDDSPSSSSSFNEIFGEMHFKESSPMASYPSSPTSISTSFPVPSYPSSVSSSILTEPALGIDKLANKNVTMTPNYVLNTNKTKHYRHSDSFSSMNSDSLSLCTEGLGFESFDDVEDSKSDTDNTSTYHRPPHHRLHRHRRSTSCIKHTQSECLYGSECKRSRISGVEFPPPISSIGRTGKPWVCFKSFRNNGRFILKEVRIPTQEFLHACREDGRLKLQFIQSSDDETIEEEEDEEEEDDINGINKTKENDAERVENEGDSS